MKNGWTRSLFTASRMAQRRNWAVKADPLLYNGAPEELYTVDSFFGHTIEEYLIPFETTARLCNLELLAPVYTCGISYADRDADKIAQQKRLPGNTLQGLSNCSIPS